MITVAFPWRVARRIVAAAFLVAVPGTRVEAQLEFGIAYPGVPMLFYTPQMAPSPTDYLHQRDQERISALGNSAQRQGGASPAASLSANPNSYIHRIRDFSGAGTYDVGSRQSLSQRAAPRQAQTASTPARQPSPSPPVAPPTPPPPPLALFFLQSGEMDWPRDAPDSAALRPKRDEADAAIKAVRSAIQSAGKANAQGVATAKWKLVSYGQLALAEVRSARSAAVSDTFHHFLMLLHQSLDGAADTRH